MSRARRGLGGVAIAADALKGAISDEQGKIIAKLRKENASLRDVIVLLRQRIKGEVAIGEFNKRCLVSAEGALHEKDAKISELCKAVMDLRTEKKRLRRKLNEKKRVLRVVNEELEHQYARAEHAEAFLGVVGNAIGIVKERIDGYGRKKES